MTQLRTIHSTMETTSCMEYGVFENQKFQANKAIQLFYLRRSRPTHILLGCLYT